MITLSGFPRVGEREELVLRLLADGASTGAEVVEQSEGGVGEGTVYSMLERLCRQGWAIRTGRGYVLSSRAVRLLHALEVAAKAFREGNFEGRTGG